MPKRRKKHILGGFFMTGAFVSLLAVLWSANSFISNAQDVSVSAIVLSGVPTTATIDLAVPELRNGIAGTNDDAEFFLTVRTSTDADDVILFTQSSLVSTGNDGTYATPIDLTGIGPGTYDFGFKTDQHLTRVLNDVTIVAGNNILNFSKTDNSAGKGSVVLLGGDVNNTGSDPATLGDDVVNSVDISTLLSVLDDDDLTGNSLRPNINQDVVVNSVDLSIMIKNLDVEGDN